MEFNVVEIIVVTIVMFAVGAFWYMVPFGKMWGKIHGFDKLSEKKQKEMQAAMGPWYGAQLVVTIITAIVLAMLIGLMPAQSPYYITFLLWLGFVMPVTASNMIFGGAPEGYVWHKIAISSGEALVRLMIAAWVIGLV